MHTEITSTPHIRKVGNRITSQAAEPASSQSSFAPVMRTHFFGALALALSDESYKRILVQELSNLLLGEMQTWAVSCAGACAELKDADGLLPSHLLQGEELPVTTLDVSKAECSKMA